MTARSVVVAAVSASVALVLAGCTVNGATPPSGPAAVLEHSGQVRLVAFDSCEQALGELRKAMLPLVGPYGLGGGGGRDLGGVAEDAAAAPPAAGQPQRSAEQNQDTATEHSGTTTHEAGVDEPDLVKTDGRRIVTVIDGTLRVVDAASRTLTASLPLPEPGGMDQLLLSGDHALVIRHGGYVAIDLPTPDRGGAFDTPTGASAQLMLIDLAGQPRILGTFGIDGRFVDARMVGQTVRVVAHSQPRLGFGHPTSGLDEPQSTERNRKVIAESTIEDWLPRYQVQQGGAVQSGRVDCAAVAHASQYSATSMLTVLSFDLAADRLGTGDPVTVVADADVVYGTADSLYVAGSGGRWLMARSQLPPGTAPAPDLQERTELYKFDISGPGRPRHVASGMVPGTLLNQYSMSQYDGHLRVATTLSGAPVPQPAARTDAPGAPSAVPLSESTVYVLAQRGTDLAITGKVGGLGRGERIYAVRFAGPLGYVVTFRQTDPLYTLDLRNPAAPKVTGELKITGYSAYLHPIGEGRLIGVGQEASDQGRVLGSQVSLFDVSDPATPRRIAQYHLPQSSSEAESDPHAFLYWPKTATLVLPIASYRETSFSSGATVLRVGDGGLTEIGQVRQPTVDGRIGPQPIRRALVVGDTLWTLSWYGLAATGLDRLDTRGWVAFGS